MPNSSRGLDLSAFERLLTDISARFVNAVPANVDAEIVPRQSMEALRNYSWPGNVRELRNVIERSMILTDGPTLHVALPDGLGAVAAVDPAVTLEDVEPAYSRRARTNRMAH